VAYNYDMEWLDKLFQQGSSMQGQSWSIPMQVNTPRKLGVLTAEKETMDLQKVVTALAERLGLTIDHKSDLVETRPGKPWGGDSFTPSNFAKVREDVDDLQEIIMGVTKYLGVEVEVEDGRKVTVTPPPEASDAAQPKGARKGKRNFERDDPF
jgi:hypothetical protein